MAAQYPVARGVNLGRLASVPMQSAHDRLWSAIADGREGILSTVGADGTPHMTNVFYLADESSTGDRVIRVSTTSLRAQGKNVLARPRAALHVAGADFFDFAVAQGSVSVAQPQAVGDDATDELFDVHRRLKARVSKRPGFDERMIADRRMVLRIAVTRVYGLHHPAVR
jgi:PPOX class probable F420-dependent enzyme